MGLAMTVPQPVFVEETFKTGTLSCVLNNDMSTVMTRPPLIEKVQVVGRLRLVFGDIVSVFFKGSDHLVDVASLVLRLTFRDEDSLWRSARREALVDTGGRGTS